MSLKRASWTWYQSIHVPDHELWVDGGHKRLGMSLFLRRFSRQVQLGEDPAVDPDLTEAIMCPIWSGNAFGSPLSLVSQVPVGLLL